MVRYVGAENTTQATFNSNEAYVETDIKPENFQAFVDYYDPLMPFEWSYILQAWDKSTGKMRASIMFIPPPEFIEWFTKVESEFLASLNK